MLQVAGKGVWVSCVKVSLAIFAKTEAVSEPRLPPVMQDRGMHVSLTIWMKGTSSHHVQQSWFHCIMSP